MEDTMNTPEATEETPAVEGAETPEVKEDGDETKTPIEGGAPMPEEKKEEDDAM